MLNKIARPDTCNVLAGNLGRKKGGKIKWNRMLMNLLTTLQLSAD